MFTRAAIHAGGAELDWACSLPEGAPLVPEFSVRALAQSPRLRRIAEGDTVLPGITCFEAPGHSPHHLVFELAGAPPTIFSSDVAKNRAELATGRADLTMDAVAHAAAIARLNAAWRRVPGTVLLPGHDLPLVLDADSRPAPQAPRAMTVEAWFGDSLEDATKFDLSG
jgi:glyoxylase-like metal-dependent hydrolase (beta-lactamase superfamily II)